nr:isochorismatase family protein [Nocardioides daphniae]
MQCLILIDLQEDFFNPPPMRPQRAGVVEAAHEWVAWARKRSLPVIEVRTVNPLDPATWALNMREDGQPVVLAGTEGAMRLHELDFEPDAIVEKRRDDAFHDTGLGDLLARPLCRRGGDRRRLDRGLRRDDRGLGLRPRHPGRDRGWRGGLPGPGGPPPGPRLLRGQYRQQVITPT